MSTKLRYISDLTGREGEDSEFGKLHIHKHPEVAGPVILDVHTEEVAHLKARQAIAVTYTPPEGSAEEPAELLVDRAVLDALVDGDMGMLLRTIYLAAIAQKAWEPRSPRKQAPRAEMGTSGDRPLKVLDGGI